MPVTRRPKTPRPVIRPAPPGPLAPFYALKMPYSEPPVTTNEQRGAGAHWAMQRKAKEQATADVCNWARHRKIPRITRCRVSVIWCRTDNARVDGDSLAPFLKAAQDGLVLAGVIPDDRCQNVVSAVMEVHPGAPRDGLYVLIEPKSSDWRSPAAKILARELAGLGS